MASMNRKPEWFQLIEGDEIKPHHQVKRTLRVMALAAPLFVLGTGFVIAQTQDGPAASVSETVSIASVQPTTTQGAESAPSDLSQPAALTASSIKPPTGGEEEEDEDEGDED